MTNITNGQVVEGVDKFYSDFRNRRIRVKNAVWIVLNQIAGRPNVDDMIQHWRQSAATDKTN
jgi:hypothetical protein